MMLKITYCTISLFAVGQLLAQTPPAPAKPKPAAATQAKPAATPAKPAATPVKPAAATAKPVAKVQPGTLAPDPVIIIIGDQKITKSQYESFINALPERIRTEATGPNKRKVAEQLADIKAMALEAKKRGIDKKPEIQVQVAFQVENFLANSLVQQMQAEAKSDDAAVQAYFEKNKKDYETATARHILIRFAGSKVPLKEGQKDLTDAEAMAKAKELQKAIQGGKDFAEVAKAESDDTGSGAQGGSLGSFGHGQMVPEFEGAAFSLPLNEVSEPIKSPFGYHVIQVSARGTKNLVEVRPEIEAKMKPDQTRLMIEELRKQANITLDENYFGK